MLTPDNVRNAAIIVVGVLAAVMILFEVLENLRRERELDREREAEAREAGLDGDPEATIMPDPLLRFRGALTRMKERLPQAAPKITRIPKPAKRPAKGRRRS